MISPGSRRRRSRICEIPRRSVPRSATTAFHPPTCAPDWVRRPEPPARPRSCSGRAGTSWWSTTRRRNVLAQRLPPGDGRDPRPSRLPVRRRSAAVGCHRALRDAQCVGAATDTDELAEQGVRMWAGSAASLVGGVLARPYREVADQHRLAVELPEYRLGGGGGPGLPLMTAGIECYAYAAGPATRAPAGTYTRT